LCDCHGLDQQSCAARPGCVARTCPDCNGGQVFSSCANPGDPPSVCTQQCPAGCRGNADCTNGELCVAPGASLGCGACAVPQMTCASDGECGSGQICDVAQCTCNGAKSCVPGCAGTACPVGQVCGNSNRCLPQPCTGTTPGECPPFFRCNLAGSSPFCGRIPCTVDADCGGGFCVDAQCYGTLGMCAVPPA
jgi:hypothetical protein